MKIGLAGIRTIDLHLTGNEDASLHLLAFKEIKLGEHYIITNEESLKAKKNTWIGNIVKQVQAQIRIRKSEGL